MADPADPVVIPKEIKPVKFAHIVDEDAPALSIEGWTKIQLTDFALQNAIEAVLNASEIFFALPTEEKRRFASQKHGSELGWSCVAGEKELITIRDLGTTPKCLKEAVQAYWAICGQLLNGILSRIEESLELPTASLTAFSEPCLKLTEKPTATMLRLFRYEGQEAFKIVAEPHSDLGLLSMVAGDTPGLECWERFSQTFYPIEKEFTEPAASLLVGTQLSRLTNLRYIPGGHRVIAYPPSVLDPPSRRSPHYRYSIVFILRAHWPVPIDTDKLTTAVTGPFQKPLRNITAWDLYKEISSSHWNINISKEVREEQRRRLDERKAKEATG